MTSTSLHFDTLAFVEELKRGGVEPKQAETHGRAQAKIMAVLFGRLTTKEATQQLDNQVKELRQEVKELRGYTEKGFERVNQEFTLVHQEFKEVHQEIASLKTSISAMGERMTAMGERMTAMGDRITVKLGGVMVIGITILGILKFF